MCRRCLYCYKPLAEGEVDFHPRCSRKIFGSSHVPELPYRRSEIKDLARQVIRAQTTLTGVQPKLSLDFDNASGVPPRFTIVGLWGRFILKPQSDAYQCLPELEDLTMHLADLAKIETVPHSLIRFCDGELCYITRRIDRTAAGGKLPMEDLCQLSERLTEDKYKGSHERIAKTISRYSSVPKLDLIRYWEVTVFSWLTGNADMHLKNFSLYAPDDVNFVLTPAYDLLATALVMPEDKEELALTLCGKKRKLVRQNFIDAMCQSGLDIKVSENIINRFVKVEPRWVEAIRRSFLTEEMQEAFLDLIHSRLTAIHPQYAQG